MSGDSAGSIPFIVGLATAGMLLLALAIVFFVVYYQKKLLGQELNLQKMEAAYQKRLLEASITSQENERKRIASDLHDEVGALLSAAKLNLNLSLRSIQESEEESMSSLESTKNMIDEAIGSVRRISKDLLPSTLVQFGLVEAMKDLCQKLNGAGPTIVFNSSNAVKELPESTLLPLYRIVQELLNNAIKHADADHIIVRLEGQHNGCTLSVEDNGKGFDHEKTKSSQSEGKGVGLFNLESRSNLIGARLNFDKGSNGGTIATVSLVKEAELH